MIVYGTAVIQFEKYFLINKERKLFSNLGKK
jgi:hypothetical protein